MKDLFKFFIRIMSALMLTTLIFSSLNAQTTEDGPTDDPRYKDTNTAQILGIVVVGGGHFYSDETGTGVILLGTAIAAPLIGTMIGANNTDDAIKSGNTGSITGPVYVGLAVSLGAWIYSIVDSPKAARRTNVKNGLAWNDDIQITPSLLATNTNRIGYGVTMKLKF